MATIPVYQPEGQYQSRLYMPQVEPPSLRPMTAAWANAARQWEETQERLKDAQDALDLANITSAVRQDMADVSEQLTKSGDPVNRGPRFMSAMQQKVQGQLSQYQNKDERFLTLANARVTQMIGEHSALEQAQGFALQNERTKVGTNDTLASLAMQGTPEAVARGAEMLLAQQKAGLWTANEVKTLKENFRKDAIENAFGRMIKVDPTGAMQAVNERRGIFGQATDIEQARMVGAAQTEIRRVREEQDYQENKIADANSSFLISRVRDKSIQPDDAIGYAQGMSSHYLNQVITAATNMRLLNDQDLYAQGFLMAKTDPAGAASFIEQKVASGEMSGTAGTAFLSIFKTIPAMYDQVDDPKVEQGVLEDFARPTPRFTPSYVASLARPGGGLSRNTAETWMLRYVEKLKAKTEGNKGPQQEHSDLEAALHDLRLIAGAVPEEMQPRINRLISASFMDLYNHAGTTEAKYAQGLRIMPYWQKRKQEILSAVGFDSSLNENMVRDTLPPDVQDVYGLMARDIAGLLTPDVKDDYITKLRKIQQTQENRRRWGVGKELTTEMQRLRPLPLNQRGTQAPPTEQETLIDMSRGAGYFTP